MSRVLKEIIVPKTLPTKYYGYVLRNGVKCIIVQDENAKMPAAAMSIRVGQLNDPQELPGLAHFCEHMLFMGTERFPKEDEYDNYISKNNGMNNAYTASDSTVYYFQVGDDALDGALERFVEFFVAPSFNENAVSREVKAVHSEDEKNRTVDFWRGKEVLRTLVNEAHPFSRYTSGNATTLVDEPAAKGINVLAELRKFYERYYVAEAACIMVYSSREPEHILAKIEEPLLRMKSGSPAAFRFLSGSDSIINENARGSWINIKTLKKARSISLKWVVQSSAALWRSKPYSYISHILGHECDCSVLGILKKKNFATDMMVGPSRIDDDFDLFTATIALTVDGFARVTEVVELVYHAIGQAIEDGVNLDVYNEMKNEDRLAFESSDVSSITSHCASMVESANRESLECCWAGSYLFIEDNLEATLEYAKQLIPENGIIILNWSELPTSGDEKEISENKKAEKEEEEEASDEEENEQEEEEEEVSATELFGKLPDFARQKANSFTRFHRAQYSKARIPEEHLNVWRVALANRGARPDGLALPPKNPYIAKSFTIYAPSSENPGGISKIETVKREYGKIFLRKDEGHYNTFKSCIVFGTLSPVCYKSPIYHFYAQVMKEIIGDALTEMSYFGELASIENTVSPYPGGIALEVCGPEEKILSFFTLILERLYNYDALAGNEDKFNTYVEKQLRGLKSFFYKQSYELGQAKVKECLSPVHISPERMLAVESNVNYNEYKLFLQEYLQKGIMYECFLTGNMPSIMEMANSVGDSIEKVLRLAKLPAAIGPEIPRFRDAFDVSKRAGVLHVLEFDPFNADDPNVSSSLCICMGEDNAHLNALALCTMKSLSSPFFNALRTRETLGYVVYAQTMLYGGLRVIKFVVQSAVENIDSFYLLSRIIGFLDAVNSGLDHLCTEENLAKIKNGLINSLKKMPNSIDSDAAQIKQDYLHPQSLDHREQLISALEKLNCNEWKSFVSQISQDVWKTHSTFALIVNRKDAKTTNLPVGVKETRILPPKISSVDAAVSADLQEGDDLEMPSFAEGQRNVELLKWDSIEAFQTGLDIIKSASF